MGLANNVEPPARHRDGGSRPRPARGRAVPYPPERIGCGIVPLLQQSDPLLGYAQFAGGNRGATGSPLSSSHVFTQGVQRGEPDPEVLGVLIQFDTDSRPGATRTTSSPGPWGMGLDYARHPSSPQCPAVRAAAPAPASTPYPAPLRSHTARDAAQGPNEQQLVPWLRVARRPID